MLRILLVEDSRILAERLSETLGQLEGVEVIAAVADESAAVEIATDQPVDVIVLDLQLKEGTGFGVVRRLGANRPTIVVFTNYSLPEYQRRAQDLGIEHFLNKSRDYERLSELIQDLERQHKLDS